MIKKVAATTIFLYISIILSWIVFDIVYSYMNPEPSISAPQLGQAASALQGLMYYQHRFPLIGFDHGTKAIAFLMMIVLPITIFGALHKRGFSLSTNLLGMIAGVLSYFVLSFSFILQATLAEYAIHLYGASNTPFARNFALYLFDWGMEQGGFSDSLYIVSNVLLGIFVFTHSLGIGRLYHRKSIWVIGWVWAVLTFASEVTPFYNLMRGIDKAHMLDQIVGMGEIIWLPMVAWWLLTGDKASGSERSTASYH